ncbi:M20 metallopeptidase family protein [Extibacter muris]|uniref:M20 metallopeptidase family protein n=1 Tax=Extibacter muris TaxID=1796622 RepID=UPI001D06034D|nr:M20 family metallopeptidase [Extibacter muris]MCB6201804.1 M20 family metallopeptidase [Extibacter muris]MCQ4663595.1 M20 family metallopeptidase [Extibacter muris]MCQ4695032.1 M20 family metallopeptidase [Extibacter muris]
MSSGLLKEAEDMHEKLSIWRRTLHRNPEVGLSLPETVKFVKEQFEEAGVDCMIYEECSCITAQIGRGGSCFLLRSDMDALPMKEESKESFASQNGCMHSCGHDLHTAILLGAARLLKAHEHELKGTVKLLFQSGEEIFEGAQAAIDARVLENPHVDAAFAMHVASAMTNNVVIYGHYPMAAVYGFRITLKGQGAHGSTPQLGVDPINTGIHIHLALQELISREISSTEEAALTIGRFAAGSAANIIPERAILEGTLRAFRPEIKDKLVKRIHEVVHSVAKAYRTEAEIDVLSSVPPVECDEELNKEVVDSIKKLDDDINVLPLYHVMGSEDFAFISEKIPASYFCIGAGLDDKSQWYGQHNPNVRFNENCLPLGAAIYAGTAMDWLASHS